MTIAAKKKLLEKGNTEFIIKGINDDMTREQRPKKFKTLSFSHPTDVSYSFVFKGEPGQTFTDGNMYISTFNKAAMKVYSVNILNKFTYAIIKYSDVTIIN